MTTVDPYTQPIPRRINRPDGTPTEEFFQWLVYDNRFKHDLWQALTDGTGDRVDPPSTGTSDSDLFEGNESPVFDADDLSNKAFSEGSLASIDTDELSNEPFSEGLLASVDSETIQDLEDEFGSIVFNDAPQLPVPQKEFIVVTGNYTTTGDEVVYCNASVTVTLNAFPADQEKVTISARVAPVTVSGSINGQTSIVISFKYSTMDLIYSDQLGEWCIV